MCWLRSWQWGVTGGFWVGSDSIRGVLERPFFLPGGVGGLEAERENEGAGPGESWNSTEGRHPDAPGECETTTLMPHIRHGVPTLPSTEPPREPQAPGS